MNEAEFRTLSKYFKISKQDHYFRILTAAADERKCMKKYNLADWKSQLLIMSKYAKYAKSARICI